MKIETIPISTEDHLQYMNGIRQKCFNAITNNNIPTSKKSRGLAALFQCASEEYQKMNEEIDDSANNNCNVFLSNIAASSYSLSDAIENSPGNDYSKYHIISDEQKNQPDDGKYPTQTGLGLSLFCGVPLNSVTGLLHIAGDVRLYAKCLDEGTIVREHPLCFNVPGDHHDNNPTLLSFLARFNQTDAFIKLFQRGAGPSLHAMNDLIRFVNHGIPAVDPKAPPSESIPWKDEEYVSRLYVGMGRGLFNGNTSRTIGVAWYAMIKEGCMFGTGAFGDDEKPSYKKEKRCTNVSARAVYIYSFEQIETTNRHLGVSVKEIKEKFANNPKAQNKFPFVSPTTYRFLDFMKKNIIRYGGAGQSSFFDASDINRLEEVLIKRPNLLKDFAHTEGLSLTNMHYIMQHIQPCIAQLRSALSLADSFYSGGNNNTNNAAAAAASPTKIPASEQSVDKFLDNFPSSLHGHRESVCYSLSCGLHGRHEAWPSSSSNDDGITRKQRHSLCIDSSFTSKHLTLFQKDHKINPGQPCFASKENFLKKWNKYSAGVLDGFYSPYALVIGGAVVSCLDPNTNESNMFCPDGGRDIDLSFPGLSIDGVQAELLRFDKFMVSKFGGDRRQLLTCSTSQTRTYVLPYPLPRVQVVLGSWESIAQVLLFSDVDCCGVGLSLDFTKKQDVYDGQEQLSPLEFSKKNLQVYLTSRALHAWLYKVNIASSTFHEIRGSIEYEMRLAKYARRYGFAVTHPVIDYNDYRYKNRPNESHLPIQQTTIYKNLQMMANDPNFKRRGQMVKQQGLAWLYLVDVGVFHPKMDTAGLLDVSSGKTLADIETGISKARGFRLAPLPVYSPELLSKKEDFTSPHPFLHKFSFMDNDFSTFSDSYRYTHHKQPTYVFVCGVLPGGGLARNVSERENDLLGSSINYHRKFRLPEWEASVLSYTRKSNNNNNHHHHNNNNNNNNNNRK